MDIFDFEELTAEMLGVTDEQREDDDYLPNAFYEKYRVDFEDGYALAQDLLLHTPIVTAGISGNKFHAFISRTAPCMLMKAPAP